MGKLKTLFRSKRDVDMTEGNILRHLVVFAVPLLMGNIFQQLYNMVDTWVVGNFVSNEAFSAVGSVGPITNMLIGFFMGLSTGSGVVISQFYGAKQYDKVHDAVHTSVLLTLLLSILFTAIGVSFTPTMLRLMKTPASVFPEAKAYLTIYFGGIGGLMFYNMTAGILRAVGDSRRPFYYLVVSAGLNTVLDLVFVLVFHMGVKGVAWATIIAQYISAGLGIIEMMRATNCIHLRIRDLKLHWDILKKVFGVGLPAAVQMAITSFSNVFVQSYINYFGADCMSGWTAYTKIDQIMLLPMQSIALSSTTFVGQNLGVGNVPRAKKGVRTAVTAGIISTVILMIPVMAFAPQLTAFFNAKKEVVSFGTMFLRWISPFYIFSCVNQVYAGALRGSGNSRVPMVIMLFSFVLFRQIYLYILTHYIVNEIIPVAMGYPAGWLISATLTVIYFNRSPLTSHRVVDNEPKIKEETV